MRKTTPNLSSQCAMQEKRERNSVAMNWHEEQQQLQKNPSLSHTPNDTRGFDNKIHNNFSLTPSSANLTKLLEKGLIQLDLLLGMDNSLFG